MADIASEYSTVVTATPTSNAFWLKDPLNPSLNRSVEVSTWDYKQTEKQFVAIPLGRRFAVVITDGLAGQEGTFTIQTISTAEAREVEKLVLKPNATLLFQSPYGDNEYIRIVGERTWKTTRTGTDLLREISVNYVEQGIP